MDYKKILEIGKDALVWDFDSSVPYISIPKLGGTWDHIIKVNPMPCSTINVELLTREVNRVEEIFPIGTLLQWVVLPYEVAGHTNAWASSSDIFYYNEIGEQALIRHKHKLDGIVVISGKRTIVHPAMAAYLSAHEYGHQVDYWINRLMNDENNTNNLDLFRKEYANMRGDINLSQKYGAGNWKGNIAEIIADDFRIVMCNTDIDFWEHPQEHPLNMPEVKKYWDELKFKYQFKDDSLR